MDEADLMDIIRKGLQHHGKTLRAFGSGKDLHFKIGANIKLLDDGSLQKLFCIVVSDSKDELPNVDTVKRSKHENNRNQAS